MGQRELELQEPNPEIGNEAFPCPPVDNYRLGASLEQALFLSLGPILDVTCLQLAQAQRASARHVGILRTRNWELES
jgi:hypothetical protein